MAAGSAQRLVELQEVYYFYGTESGRDEGQDEDRQEETCGRAGSEKPQGGQIQDGHER